MGLKESLNGAPRGSPNWFKGFLNESLRGSLSEWVSGRIFACIPQGLPEWVSGEISDCVPDGGSALRESLSKSPRGTLSGSLRDSLSETLGGSRVGSLGPKMRPWRVS